jgi:sodium/hydrogen antiporter
LTELHVALLALGFLVLLIGFFSIPLERLPLVSQPILALALGMMVGPLGMGWLNPAGWSGAPRDILSLAAELTMAIALMEVALRLPPRFFRNNARSMSFLLGLGMPLMWLLASASRGPIRRWRQWPSSVGDRGWRGSHTSTSR